MQDIINLVQEHDVYALKTMNLTTILQFIVLSSLSTFPINYMSSNTLNAYQVYDLSLKHILYSNYCTRCIQNLHYASYVY